MRAALVCCWIVLLGCVAFGKDHKHYGYVPDAETAIKIADSELSHVYGKKQIQSEHPLTARLKDGIWTVWGSLHCPDGKGGVTDTCLGGVARIEMSERDVRILSISHTK